MEVDRHIQIQLVLHHAHTQAPDLKVMEEARVREKAECEDATGIKYVCVCACVHGARK